MNTILIKKVSRPGCDPELFRAYTENGSVPRRSTSLKVTASCTGGTEFGVICCAAKAFAKYGDAGERNGDVNEIESRIKLTEDKDVDGLWIATLQPKEAK